MNAKSAKKKRLDLLLVERGLAENAQKAAAMILAGEVEVDGNRAGKAGVGVAETARVEVFSRSQKYVSRGGFKLQGALEDFAVSVTGKVCLDVGASTGGFTDCLLQNGAKRVYAVDVNTDQIAWKLREDARVRLVKTNARELSGADLQEPVDVVVVDVSFISVAKVLRGGMECAKDDAEFLILIKPQFELERGDVGPGGIVREAELHEKAMAQVRKAAVELGLLCGEVAASRLPGAEGNQEYFLHARKRVG
ncbi:MAG: TlyA family RNA methyltransferase [Candidatus Acidiferrum sp.]